MVYFNNEEDDQFKVFKEFAHENRNKMKFTHSTISEDLGARLSEFLGVTETDSGCVRIIQFSGDQLNKYKVDFNTKEDLEKALKDFEDSKLSAYFKSETIPETNSEAVKVVVGDTFEEMVLKNDKFVFLEAYAPWCGHCKKLEPIYKDLAEQLAGNDQILIAKFDATANEHPSL